MHVSRDDNPDAGQCAGHRFQSLRPTARNASYNDADGGVGNLGHGSSLHP